MANEIVKVEAKLDEAKSKPTYSSVMLKAGKVLAGFAGVPVADIVDTFHELKGLIGSERNERVQSAALEFSLEADVLADNVKPRIRKPKIRTELSLRTIYNSADKLLDAEEEFLKARGRFAARVLWTRLAEIELHDAAQALEQMNSLDYHWLLKLTAMQREQRAENCFAQLHSWEELTKKPLLRDLWKIFEGQNLDSRKVYQTMAKLDRIGLILIKERQPKREIDLNTDAIHQFAITVLGTNLLNLMEKDRAPR